jgi:iron complex outermembrane receptor protein
MTTSRVTARCDAPRLGSLSLLAIAIAAPPLAMAQTTAGDEEIIVTGSRVSRSGFDSSQPLTTIDSEQIENLGLVNVGDVIRTLPQNTPFFTETNVGIGNFNVGAQLANLRGLNPFFGTRTLTLIDTRRVVPTTEGGAVDLTLIPSMLVERTEVVTGGASAQYGSDAIAGVVNVILDKDLDGFKAQLDYGQTGEGDGGDTHGSFAWGTGFGNDGRGHVIAGIEYQKQDRIGPCSYNRDWCAEGWGIANRAGVAGQPNFVISRDAKQTTSQYGVIQSCLTASCVAPAGQPAPLGPNLTFNADGTAVSPFNLGVTGIGFATRIGGDGTLLGYGTSNVRPEVERYSAMAHVRYDVSDRLSWFGEVAYSSSDALGTPANGGLGPTGLRIQGDNAFLAPAVAAALGPNGGQLARIFMPDVVNALNTTDNETTRLVAGLEGKIGSDWTWDVYYQHGENENHQKLFNNMVGSLAGGAVRQYDFLRWALDAVRSNPAVPTSPIVCRATLPTYNGVPNPTFSANAAGCVPLNIFGNGNATPAALAYTHRTLQEDNEYSQDALGVNFRSTIAEGWAGPIALAAGFEWRSDEAETTHDIPNQPWYSSYLLSYGLDRGGDIDVAEVYAEIDVPMSEKLNTNFSMRQTRNEATSAQTTAISGDDTFSSWKAAAIYDPLEWLRFRTTLSRDVRAAGFRELFLPRTTVVGFATVNNPWTTPAGLVDTSFAATAGGNPDLSPEEADTKTFGAVFSFERFRVSADWFEIDLANAITQSPGNQPLVTACFNSGGTGPACDRIVGEGTNDITAIDSGAMNLAGFLTRGWDYEATFDFPLQGGANLNLRLIGTYLYDMIVDTGLGPAPIDYRGQSGPVASFGSFNTQPDWQARAFLTYARDRFTSTIETRYVGSGKLNAIWFESPPGSPSNTQLFSVSDNSVDDAYYLSWSGSYDFERAEGNGIQLFWVINNLLDKDPVIAPGGNAYPTNPVFFDTLGRRYRAGVRISF